MGLGEHSAVRAPGTLASHYAPRAIVEVVTAEEAAAVGGQDARIGLLALDEVPTPLGVVRLAAPPAVDDYARVLYAALREADALELTKVVAVPPAPEGVGAAVCDRLARAATR
jgi:L-threonylcarbamoyladenylate synthase